MSIKLGGKKRFKSMKSALRSLNKDTMPKNFDEVKDFLGRITDEKYGLGTKPVTLADVMSYQDDPEMEDFDFFETYYNSEAAKSNRKRSEELYEELYNLSDDEQAFVDSIAFKGSREVAKTFEEMFKSVMEEASEEEDDNTESDKSKDEKPPESVNKSKG